ncbi:MAG TPA: UDP-N-acetylglucosamine--N-acetylmuramyl-(pentapeptide) pyrophosphoryl-undecaprenol N-acetylglucosamine transferase, partial [Phycisphaerales bacterium]|nr:UDP-N-acetylglucosamine--N-acetylmuramyl-(pentapeptide) pyrophosphoryl-undecaprenol N-acetylglucosamine transferase [Phycisphaerales bacterium]
RDALRTTYLPIPAAPLALSPRALARFAWRWGGAVRAAREALRRMKAECSDVRILATGGFVAAPVAQAARIERVPLLLLNQDAPPGKANRWIARIADSIFTTAQVDRPGWTPIPPVVRRAALAPGDAAQCRRELGLDPERPVLFVTGASQGSRSVNEFLAGFVRAHAAELRADGWQVIHQTGSADNATWRAAYDEAGIPAVVEQFFDSVGVCWGAADAAVSRAGAGSVAEVWANRVPTLFLPYPYHRDQHQRLNAEPLVRAGAALIERDHIQPEPNLAHAGPALLDLLRSPTRRHSIRAAVGGLGPVDGAARLAAAIIA